MVDAVIFNAAGGILEKVILLAADEIICAWGFKKKLNKLQESFEMIEAVLQDAEAQQSTKTAVKLWLKKLKDVAGEADDVLDEIQYEMLRRKVEIRYQMARKVSSLKFRIKMGRKIKDINTRLADINKEATGLGLQRQSADTSQVIQNKNEETDSFLDEFSVIGRDDDASVLIETLIGSSNEEKLTIIPIVGMGGLGKTTLAKLIFNNEQVKGHFSERIWVCVAVEVDVETLLRHILESLTRKKEEVQTRENIIKRLKEELGRKKYLLVLDDVWNEEGAHWDDFKSCMFKVNEGSGNSIIVTTRSKEIASNAQTLSMLPLEQLSDDLCWSIIQERAFAAGGPSETQDLVDIGKDIAKKCGGVPLVAKVVGGMLRSKKGIDGWLSVQSSAVWDSKEGDRVLSILKLSFDNLPNLLLKQCFAYCSIFRKDAFMYKEELIELWMALGFLQADEARKKDMEDVGHDFFKILVQNSLFQDVKKDGYDNIMGCKMHDLVHDLALSLSKSECFNSEVLTSNDTIPRVRHVALYSERDRMFSELQEKEKARYLHTLFFGYGNVPESLLLKFKCLRILNLHRSFLERLPDSIDELIHLRYLDLSKNGKVKVLPKSVGRLYHLQTLDLQGCKYLKELPNEVRNLINLRHLYIDVSCKLPLGVGKFTCLRSLSFFRVGREKGCQIEELGCLRNLRGKLKVLNLEEVGSKEEAQSAHLVGKGNLYGLKYVWSDEREGNKAEDKEVLDGLQAPPNLKTLEIKGFMGDNFPEWLLKMAVSTIKGTCLPLHNLVDIKFSNFRRCEHVPMLGQLPFLQTLVLVGMSNVKCIDSLFYGTNYDTSTSSGGDGGGGGGVSRSKPVFPALRSFRIESMKKLVTWMDESATTGGGINRVVVFPCLEKLEIIRCAGLTSLPSGLLGSCTSLRDLTISFCSGLTSLPSGLLGSCTSLRDLTISFCLGLTSLPSGLLGSCTSLIELEISYCSGLTSLPSGLLGSCTSLRQLTIRNCSRLTSLPSGLLGFCTSLSTLTIEECSGLTSLPSGLLGSCTSLSTLTIEKCSELTSLPSGLLGSCTSLRELKIQWCSELTSLPSGLLGSCTSLSTLDIDGCPNLMTLPKLHNQSHSLQYLGIIRCEKVGCLPEGYLSSLNVLEYLEIGPMSEDPQILKLSLQAILRNSNVKLSLRELRLKGRSEWESIPEEVQHLTALTSISLDEFGLVEALPDWFANLSSLEELGLYRCSKLKSLPSMEAMQRLTKLESIFISDCPLLKERVAKGSGPEWSKIAHVSIFLY